MVNSYAKGDLVHVPSEVYLFRSANEKKVSLFSEDWKVTRRTKTPQLGIFREFSGEKAAVIVLPDGEWVVDARHIYPAEADHVNRVNRNKIQLSKQI
jgi:hypothetical protein